MVIVNSGYHKRNNFSTLSKSTVLRQNVYKEYRLKRPPNYYPARGAKLLACQGRQLISLPGASSYLDPAMLLQLADNTKVDHTVGLVSTEQRA